VIDRRVLHGILESTQDDAYEIAEIWGPARDAYPSESKDRWQQITRDAVLDLLGRGLVRLVWELSPGEYRELSPAEVEQVRRDSAVWARGERERNLLVEATDSGIYAMRRGEFRQSVT
jgi:hypothetical protein